MFFLLGVICLFSARGSTADPDTLNGEEIAAEAGLCVVIPCSTTGSNITWFKCDPSKEKCGSSDILIHSEKTQEIHRGFIGRVSLLEPDMTQKNCSIIINDLTESDSGLYQLNLMLQKTDKLTFSQNVSVRGLIQKPTVMIPPLKEGQQTTLTCTAPGLCSGSDPNITWTWRGRGENDSHITGNVTAFKTENLTAITRRHSSNLTFNASAEHHGTEVTCKVSYKNNITTEKTVTLNVTFYPKIIYSGCEVRSEILTCMCVSQPTNTLSPFETYTEYSVSMVSNHTVNGSVTVSVKDHKYTVRCVSKNTTGEAKNFTTITNESKPEDLFKKLLIIVKQPEVIFAFLIGILLSATVCCLSRTCCRKRRKRSRNMSESLEMVTARAVPLMNPDQSVNYGGTNDQEAAERGAEAAGQSVPNGDVEPNEVEYSSIDFARSNRNIPAGAEGETSTEYAELKKEKKEERQDDDKEDGEMMEEVPVKGKDESASEQSASVEKEEMAVYSNMDEMMGV